MKTTIQNEIEKLIKAVQENKEIYVICPCCERGKMEYGYNGASAWVCLWRDCFFKTKEIPSVYEIKDLIYIKKQLKQIKEWKI